MSSALLVTPTSGLVNAFKLAYGNFDGQTVGKLKDLYMQSAVFVDPVHRIEGLPALERYFAASAKNLTYCRFEFIDEVVAQQSAFFKWRMQYAHKKIARGADLQVTGASLIKFSECVYYHEDFYDLGAMVYEHIPLLRLGVKKVKQVMAAAGSVHGR